MTRIVVEYVAAAAVFGALSGIGTLPTRLIERRVRPPHLLDLPLLAMAGWGLVALLSAVGAVAEIGQVWLARFILALGLLLLLPFRRATRAAQTRLLIDLALLFVLVAPMGLLVAGTPALAFDEFAQWLPNTRYLVEHGHYWSWPDWIGQSDKPGYPNGSAVIALLASRLAGPDVEASFKTFAVIMLGAYGAALAGLAATRWRPEPRRLTTVALFAGGILVALLDPFMDPRIGFTAYTDMPSAVVLAIAVLAASCGLTAVWREDHPAASGWFAWAGLLSLTLVLLRQTDTVLVAAMDGGCGLLLVIRGAGAARRWRGWALRLIAPPAIGELVWRAHLWLAGIGPDIAPRPLAAWDWSAPLTVVRAFVRDRLAGNPLAGGAALLLAIAALVAGVAAWRRRAADEDDGLPAPRLIVSLAAIVSLCFTGFLAWAYIAVFSAAEIATAASLWRYLGELAPMLIVAGCCVVLRLVPARLCAGRFALAGAVLGAGLLVLLPYAGRGYYRLDCRFPDVAAARAAIADLRPALAPFAVPAGDPARLAVVNPTMGDWMAYALAFDMRWPVTGGGIRFRKKNETLGATEAWAWDQGLDALLDLTPLDRAALRARRAVPAVALLARPAAKGEPWPVLAATRPRPLPACTAWGPGR